MRVQDQVLQEHGGELFTDSIKLLYESHEERDGELGIADEGCDRLEARPDKLKEISERLYRENNYQFFEDSVEVIREMREERLRELMGEE
jgi:hypothetical protein